MKIESQFHLKLFYAVTKYFGKMLSHRQMMISQNGYVIIWPKYITISNRLCMGCHVDRIKPRDNNIITVESPKTDTQRNGQPLTTDKPRGPD